MHLTAPDAQAGLQEWVLGSPLLDPHARTPSQAFSPRPAPGMSLALSGSARVLLRLQTGPSLDHKEAADRAARQLPGTGTGMGSREPPAQVGTAGLVGLCCMFAVLLS